MTTQIKICGINTLDAALAAAQEGADYLGFIFAMQSPRYVALSQALSIAGVVKTHAPAVSIVAVFKGNLIDEIRDVIAQLHPDVVQLHGADAAELAVALHNCGCKIWCDVRTDEKADVQCDALLVDSPQPGSGKLSDWRLAQQLVQDGKRIVLAGGIGINNLRDAMQTGAAVLDVNSTLEDSPGHKSIAKITQLLKYYRELRCKNRIEQLFAECRSCGRKVFVAFMTIGFPNIAFSERAVATMLENGVGIIEFGVPYAEPFADGAVIREADRIALANGTTIDDVFQCIKRLRTRFPKTPFALFSYCAPIKQYGLEQFAYASKDAGVDAVLVVDAQGDDGAELRRILRANAITTIPLLYPDASPDTLAQLTAGVEDSFIYAINVNGATGERKQLPKDLPMRLESLRRYTTMPIVAGFGISTPQQAAMLAEHADGFVVGSALVKILLEAPDEYGLARLAASCNEFLAMQTENSHLSYPS